MPPSASVPSEVADGGGTAQFRVQWDFSDEDPAWEAEILTGELKGEPFKCKLANLCADKWASLGTAVAVPFEDATFAQKKEGARVYIERYCAGRVKGAAGSASTVGA